MFPGRCHKSGPLTVISYDRTEKFDHVNSDVMNIASSNVPGVRDTFVCILHNKQIISIIIYSFLQVIIIKITVCCFWVSQ